MKTRNYLLLVLLTFLVNSCFVKSLHPFYRENEIIFRKDLLGVWTGDDSSVWKIEQGKRSTGFLKPSLPDNSYEVTYTDKKGSALFNVRLFQVAGHLFLDFYPKEVESTNDMMASHLVPMHTVARVDLAGGKIMLRWYNEEWLISLFKQNKIRISHEKIPTDAIGDNDDNFQIILTASTEDLQKFMIKYSDDPNAFKKDFTFVLSKKGL